LSQTESANKLTKLVESTIVSIEPYLEGCAYVDEDEEKGAVDESIPEITKANLTRKVTQKELASLDIPQEAKDKIENILHFSGYDCDTGLEEEMLQRANRYLYDQALCLREVDYARLSKRLSSCTAESDILKYMSFFDQESIAYEMDAITFTATDRASAKPFSQVGNNFTVIRDIKRRIDGAKLALLAQAATDRQESPIADSSAELQKHIFTAGTGGADDSEHSEANQDYPGFVQTGPDMYTKISNPHFVCNQRAAASYASYRMSW
jgi:hypothetical protein